ncbi:MAG: BrnA antitoxin family protein [Nitrospirae bacterium]|nr:BrnA antitoxin family protein [Magnetococcales bacterium]HAT49358.1 CopG family transcriptional regulator [Alphaproteobacteria bacterium]
MKTKEGFDFSDAKRGAVLPQVGRTRITINLSDDVIAEFRSRAETAGTGYQIMINDALRAYLEMSKKPLEETLRKVIREELQAAG